MEETKWDGNGWSQYQKLVLNLLEEHGDGIRSVDSRIQSLHIEIAMIKTEMKLRAGFWGFIAALVPVVGGIVFELLLKH